MTRHLHRIEALVLTVLLVVPVLIARLISAGARQGRLAHAIPEPCSSPTKQAPMVGLPAPAAPLQPAPMVVAACTAPAPAAGRQAPPLEGMTVHQLRKLAQAKGITTAGGKRTSKANRAALLEALA